MVSKALSALNGQIRVYWRTLALIVGAALFFIGIALLLHLVTQTPLGDLTRDPLATAQLPFYVGFVSQVGLMLWAACVAVTLFAMLMLPDATHHTMKRFLLMAGIFTLFLALDDAFLLHEEVFPKFGIPELLVYIGYFGLFAAFLFVFRRQFSTTPYVLLLTALVCFALSIGFDELPLERWNINPFLIEDGFKLMGIMAWGLYFAWVSLTHLRAVVSAQG